MKLEFPLLTKEQIEVKIRQVGKNGASALLYKTARTDMDMLDSVVGADKWRNDYTEIKGNLYCTIYVRDESGEWVGKQDCGIESRADGDGNEKKGEASDAFKRAGFRWGIGRELYTAPFVFLDVATQQDNGRWVLADHFARYAVGRIGYDSARRICALDIVDESGNVVYSMTGKSGRKPLTQKQDPAAAELAARAAQRLREWKKLQAQCESPDDPAAARRELIQRGLIRGGKLTEMDEGEYFDTMHCIRQYLADAGACAGEAS